MSAARSTTSHDNRCDCMSGVGREMLTSLVLPLFLSYAVGISSHATYPQPGGPAPVAFECPAPRVSITSSPVASTGQ